MEEEEAKRGDTLHWTQQKAPWIDPETGGVREDEKVEHGMEKKRKNMQNQKVLRVVTYKQYEEALRSGRKVVLVKTGWVLRRKGEAVRARLVATQISDGVKADDL